MSVSNNPGSAFTAFTSFETVKFEIYSRLAASDYSSPWHKTEWIRATLAVILSHPFFPLSLRYYFNDGSPL